MNYPRSLFIILCLLGAGAIYWLSSEKPEQPNKNGSTSITEDGMPSGEGGMSSVLFDGLTGDAVKDVETLKQEVLSLREDMAVLRNQNEQLLERLRVIEEIDAKIGEKKELMTAEQAMATISAERKLPPLEIAYQAVPWVEFQRLIREQNTRLGDAEIMARRLRAWNALGVFRNPPALAADVIFGNLEAEQAGFYSEDFKTLTIVNEEEKLASPDVATRRLSALGLSLVHAHLDTKRLPLTNAKSDDERMAALSLLHGDAQYFASIASMKAGLQDDPEMLNPSQTAGREMTEGAPIFVREYARFPRAFGVNFVQQLMQRGDLDAVNEAYRHPPVSTAEIFDPELYQPSSPFQPIRPEMPEGMESLPVYWDNVMGQMGTILVLKQFVPDEQVFGACEGWRGDRLWVASRDGKDALLWITEWLDEEQAEEFFVAMTLYATKAEGLSEGEKPIAEWKENGIHLKRDGKRVIYRKHW